ncbi:GTP 3',8-cyclase MoaA [uncultured Pseudoteredinibacter sp.]|uniref:GTP 3',8-cyclase MoaA n=1 Tax=uncultured Pseudoteredinibacter sp. TaxID=1641701 RepID=UPI002627AB81|nr:GTP 3',8-cyclase MoaA [uncultured Pseudoteredinibacter sp.]
MTLSDSFGRQIDYLRLSLTDRCDFRCVYCMAEDMEFLPRAQVLSLEECETLVETFVQLGIKKVRLTGGEPLIRNGVVDLVRRLKQIPGLEELLLTTNGSRLEELAPALKTAGLDRINVSLDTLDADRFKALSRTGKLEKVLAGLQAAKAAGFKRIKLNSVILKNRNADELENLVEFALQERFDISFIEAMPLGHIDDHQRSEEFISSADIQDVLQKRWQLKDSNYSTGGPSRYWQINDSQIGFISPHSDNFCASCNRIRVTAEGRLLLCLGNEHSLDLKAIMRRYPGETERLKNSIIDAMGNKPERHHFDINETQIVRFMNTTGG